MGIRNRFLERIGIQAEPELVERASRRERWRRQAWMFASTAIAWSSVISVLWVVAQFVSFPPVGVGGAVVGVVTVIVVILIDLRLFNWGLDRFEIVEPWQFREEPEENRSKTVPDPNALFEAKIGGGPDNAKNLVQAEENSLYVSGKTAYRYEDGEWVDLNADTEWLIETLKEDQRL